MLQIKNQMKYMLNKLVETNDNHVGYTVSYCNTVHSELDEIPFSEVLQTIRTGNGILSIIEQVRAVKDQNERNALKAKNLPAFSMGLFENKRHKNEFLKKIQHIIIDFDHVGDRLNDLRAQLTKDERVYCLFTSPSGDGLKLVCVLDQPITNPETYKQVYEHYTSAISRQYKQACDNTKDASRMCFVSFDPDLLVNPNAVPLAVNIPSIGQAKPLKQQDPLAELLSAGTTPSNRTLRATEIIGHCIARGITQEVTMVMLKSWNKLNTPPHAEKKIVDTVTDMYARYNHPNDEMPFEIIEKHGAYYKITYRNDRRLESMISSFRIEPLELLQLDDSDCLSCRVITARGYTYENVLIENTDWHTKTKLLKAIGHQDCTFHGSENDVQALCSYVNRSVPIRKKGTKVVGLLPEVQTWVTEGLNITRDEIANNPTIIAYDKGKAAFYHGIRYEELNDAEYSVLVSGLYADLMQINEENIIAPWISWIFASPVKPIIMDHVGGFPLTFVHGPQGGGKTSSARLLKRLCGYVDSKPHSCKQNWFPLLKLLTATNAVPIMLDEFKAKLLDDRDIRNIVAFMNKSYSGEIEVKGREDQTTRDYVISAPMCVMGEWNISVPSVHERILVVRFKQTVKKDKNMQEAFKRLWQLPLEGFMPRYIQFCLQQDIPQMFNAARTQVEQHFGSITVAPRIVDNLAVMVLGMELFRKCGLANGVTVPTINTACILDHQLKEVTGSNSGFVQSAVDQLINELSIIAMKEKPEVFLSGMSSATRDPNGRECFIRENQEYKRMRMNNKARTHTVDALVINFNKIFPDFKQYAKHTDFEGDLLDKESYLRLFAECPYIIASDHAVKFNGKTVRALVVDVLEAKNAGINLEGFGIE